jgi:FMN phosphatase YigB (HAD superfamily)
MGAICRKTNLVGKVNSLVFLNKYYFICSFMKYSQFDTIIFDLGGVLLNIDYTLTANAFKDLGIRDFDGLYSQAKQNSVFDDLEIGKLSPKGFIDYINLTCSSNFSQDQVIAAWNAMLLDFPIERMILLEKLQKSHNLILMSNTNEIHIMAFKEIMEKSFGYQRFENVFDKLYLSSQIGRRKPDESTFEWILSEIKLNATQCLFIDDSEQHIIGARKIGITSHHLQHNEEITELFKSEDF